MSPSPAADPPDELVATDADDGARVPFVPSDNTTLTSVLDGFVTEGYIGHLTAEEGGSLVCSGCGNATPAAEFRVDAVRRLEGASEPDEMVSVVAARCPRCGQLGSAVLGYGPVASGADTDVAAQLPGAPGR